MMKRIACLVIVAAIVLPGCYESTACSRPEIVDWFLPGTTELDNSRHFWDQTSDHPYR